MCKAAPSDSPREEEMPVNGRIAPIVIVGMTPPLGEYITSEFGLIAQESNDDAEESIAGFDV